MKGSERSGGVHGGEREVKWNAAVEAEQETSSREEVGSYAEIWRQNRERKMELYCPQL